MEICNFRFAILTTLKMGISIANWQVVELGFQIENWQSKIENHKGVLWSMLSLSTIILLCGKG